MFQQLLIHNISWMVMLLEHMMLLGGNRTASNAVVHYPAGSWIPGVTLHTLIHHSMGNCYMLSLPVKGAAPQQCSHANSCINPRQPLPSQRQPRTHHAGVKTPPHIKNCISDVIAKLERSLANFAARTVFLHPSVGQSS